MSKQAPDPVFCLRGSGSPVSSVKFQNEDTLYSGHTDGKIHAWSMKTKRTSLNVSAHPGHSVLWMDFIDDSHMVSQGRNGEIKLWTLFSDCEWTQTGEVTSASLGFCKGCLLDKQTVAAPGSDQSEVKVHDLASGKVTANLQADLNERKYGMCMSIKSRGQNSDTTNILIGYEDGSVALWDTRTNKMADILKVHDESVMCMAYSPTLCKGYTGSANEMFKSWSCDDNGLKVKDIVNIVNPGFGDVIVRDDDKIVVTAGWDAKIRVFGAKRLRPLAVLNYHKEGVNCLTFSPSKLLACGSKDNQISLWDVYR